MPKRYVSDNLHKKVPLDSLQKSHQKCRESLQRAKDMIEKTKEQYFSINSELHQKKKVQSAFSTPARWLRRGVTSSPQPTAPQTRDGRTSLEYCSSSYLHQVLGKLSRSPPPSGSSQELLMISPNESRGASRKSVSFAEEDELESVASPNKDRR